MNKNLSKKHCGILFLKAIMYLKLKNVEIVNYKQQTLTLLNDHNWNDISLITHINNISKSQFKSALIRANKLLQQLNYTSSSDLIIDLTPIANLKPILNRQELVTDLISIMTNVIKVYKVEGEVK